jgi:transposase
VGRSKEHRVDPQVQVGLLVDPSGFPLDVYMFPGNAAETKTLVPVVTRFLQAHPPSRTWWWSLTRVSCPPRT